MTGQEPTTAERAAVERVAVVLEALKRTLNRYRWCWDCGTTESQCKGRARSVGAPQKCCPDCRHRGWPEQLDVDPEPALAPDFPNLPGRLAAEILAEWSYPRPAPGWDGISPRLERILRVVDAWLAPQLVQPGMEADGMIRRMRGE